MTRKNATTLILLFVIGLFLACGGKTQAQQNLQGKLSEPSSDDLQARTAALRQQEESHAIQTFIQNLAPVQRYSQLFLVNLEGNQEFCPVESFQWGEGPEQELVPGGYLFFSYNVADSAQKVASFTASIQDWCRERGVVPPLLSVDQEGGVVNRLRDITSVLPSAQKVARNMTVSQARELYRSQAAQMKALGFHLNLAPVAEATSIYNREFLDTRSFGPLPAMEDLARAAIVGFQEAGLGAVAKHFPGNTNDDPHTGLPEINLSQKELRELYLEPFKRIIQNSEPWAVLMSHARTAAHDSETPACLSRYWVTEVLRKDFGYQGLVLSDDIFMAALEKNGFPPERAAVMAIEAGIDVIMLSEKRFGSVLELLLNRSQEDSEFKSLLDSSVERIILTKVKSGLMSFQEGEDGLTLVSNHEDSGFSSWNEEDFQSSLNQGQELYRDAFVGGP